MRFLGALALAGVLSGLTPAPALPQAPPDTTEAVRTGEGAARLFARDAERVATADRLLQAQDVDRYEIAVCVDPRGGRLSSECVIHVRCERGPLRLLLDEGFSISALRDDRGTNLGYERRGRVIHIALPPVPSDHTRSLTMRYSGPLRDTSDAHLADGFALLADDRRWYPSPPEYDAATFRIVVRYPEGHSSVCTGALAGMAPIREASRDPCTVGDVWAADTPIPAAALVVGRFASSLSVSGNLFLGCHWIEDPNRRGRPISSPERGIKELVRFLESCYGPYPYGWLNVVSVPAGALGDASVVAGPGLVAIDESVWKRPDGDGYDLARLGEGLSSTWWRYWIDAGQVVASGLAGHSTIAWHEAMGDEEVALRLRERRRAEYVRALADSGGRAPLGMCLGADASIDARICRGKSSAVFGVLERVIGREAFCEALGGLTAEGGGVVDLESVARVFEASAGRPLDWFFYEWFHRGDLPAYSLEYEIVADRTGPAVRGAIRQEGEIYRTPVPLTIELGGWSYDEWVSIESSEQRFELRTDMVPVEVLIDGRRLIPRADHGELAAAHFQRGLEAVESGDWGAAVDEFGEASSLDWDNALYRYRHGDALARSGRLAAGLDVLESTVELAPDEPAYRLTLARLYLGALAHDEALSHFDEYVRRSDDPEGHLGRARAFIGLGQLDEARDAIGVARARVDAAGAPSAVREEFFLVLGSLHEAAGDSAAAVAEYARALEVNPVSDEARRRLEALGHERE